MRGPPTSGAAITSEPRRPSPGVPEGRRRGLLDADEVGSPRPEATLDALYWIWATFATLAGLVLGSFWNVAIARWPEDRSVVAPRSHCPYCGTTLGAGDLIPVVSYLLLRGRCRTCASPLSPAEPLIEMLGGLLAFLLFRRLIPGPEALDAPHVAAWVVFMGFISLLVIAAYVDLRHWIIPDETSIYAVPAGVLSAVVLSALGYDGWLAWDWRSSVVGAVMGGGVLATTSLVFRFVQKRDALGWGDVKLMAMIGSFVGPLPVVFLVLLPGSLLGAVVGLAHLAITRRRGYLPFGPSLAAAAVAYVLYGDAIARTFLPGVAITMGWS